MQYKITIKQLLLHKTGLRSNKNPILDAFTANPVDMVTINYEGNFENSLSFVKNKKLFLKPGKQLELL